jgi:hypothetical protein
MTAWLASIVGSVVVIALAVTMAGCEQGASTITRSEREPAPDKAACPPVSVTYVDPQTADVAWSGGIKDFAIIHALGRYHLLHITDPQTGWTTRNGEHTFGHATSLDLVTWQTRDRIDLRTDPGGWSPSFTWAPHVVFNEADGLYYMFYTGVDWAEDKPPSRAEQRVGLAVSADMFLWERYDADGQDGLILDGPDHEAHSWSAFDMDHVDVNWEYDCRDPFVFDRGPDAGYLRYVMLNSVRLAPDAQQMAIAFAVSPNLVHWQWLSYFPITVGLKAESACLVEQNGDYYLFWTDQDDAPAVRVACSTTGVFGDYQLVNHGDWLFGIGNETLRDGDRLRYLAFDDRFVLHLKQDLLLPAVPAADAPVRVLDFTRCDGVDGPRIQRW